MLRSIPQEIDLAQISQQFCADLARAQSLEAGVACCIALLDTCFSPHSCQVVLVGSADARVLGPQTGPPMLPEAEELLWLEKGELVIRPGGEHALECIAPLLARGTLTGWLVLRDPIWNAESPAAFALIAAHAGPTLAMLDIANRQDERVAQLQTLNEIGRVISGVLHLDTLLEAIYEATRRVVDAPNFYIALYEPHADILTVA